MKRQPATASDNGSNAGNTAHQILDIAEALIQTRGFNAFSYQDIADALGIRKASIHYHFASKADLGAAVMARYRDRLEAAMREAAANPDTGAWNLLQQYFSAYFMFAETPDKVCLSGSLAGEFPALPGDVQKLVAAFFEDHQNWLARVLEKGRKAGDLSFAGKPAQMARLVFDALQGALLVKRTTGDMKQLDDVVAVLKAMLVVKA